MKTTRKELEVLIDRLNEMTGSPMAPYIDGKTQIGNYHIDHNLTGYQVDRICNESGGVSCPFGAYRLTAWECYIQLLGVTNALYQITKI